MRKKLVFGILVMLLVLVTGMTGCQEAGGVAQEVYDRLQEQYQDLQEQIARIQATPTTTTATTIGTSDCEEQLAALQSEIDQLREKYVLEGETKQETAENIVRYYNDTHNYSKIDLFMCSDMSSEVWNMLDTVGISAMIAIGDINGPVADIVDCDHAWVLALVNPGEYLALETTAGFSVPVTENPYYYRGWSFDSPADLKSYNEKIREYNTLVGVRNTVNDEVNEAIEKYNSSANQAEADKYLLLYETLKSLRESYEAQLNTLKAEIEALATPINL